MKNKLLYFIDDMNNRFDTAYIDGYDVNKSLIGFFFEFGIINNALVYNRDKTINLDYDDMLLELKEEDDIPEFNMPLKKWDAKVIKYANKIGPRSSGFYIRKSNYTNRMFSEVNIVKK